MILNYPKSNFSLQMIKSNYRKCQQFRVWLCMPNLIQLEILVSDLSFLKVITTCKKQRHLLILSGDINDQSIIKSNCQAHFDDNLFLCMKQIKLSISKLFSILLHTSAQSKTFLEISRILFFPEQGWPHPTKSITPKFIISLTISI